MNLVFIHWGHYDGFKSVLACAKARCNCPIRVISAPVVTIQKELAAHVGEWCSYSLSRWFVLRDLVRKEPDLLPVFCCDWDVMIFQDLAKAYEPFKDFDYTVSIDGGMASAAYGVNNFEALDALCNLVQNNLTDKTLNDMEAWSRLTRTGKWKAGNLFEIKNDSVFDHNIVCGADRFEMVNGCKQVVWKDGYPYFKKHDCSLVKAATIHCWGPYKSKPDSLLKLAGIKP